GWPPARRILTNMILPQIPNPSKLALAANALHDIDRAGQLSACQEALNAEWRAWRKERGYRINGDQLGHVYGNAHNGPAYLADRLAKMTDYPLSHCKSAMAAVYGDCWGDVAVEFILNWHREHIERAKTSPMG